MHTYVLYFLAHGARRVWDLEDRLSILLRGTVKWLGTDEEIHVPIWATRSKNFALDEFGENLVVRGRY